MTDWVRTPTELEALAGDLARCRRVALDSESDSLYHHREKVCLLQVATDSGRCCLVDTLALRRQAGLPPAGPAPAALLPLAAVLADPAVLKVLHGADYDVTTLKRDFGFSFASLFDTMIAARFLGRKEIGLQAVARAELGVELSKTSQTDDWSRRPLSPAQEGYALSDVRHLLAVHSRLEAELREKGRLAWVEEECAAVAALDAARRREDGLGWQDLKGVRRLPPRALAVVRELHAWREAQAAATDVPPFKIASTETLLSLAERPPRTVAEIGQIRGAGPRLRHEAAAVLQAIERALALPDAELPRLPRPPKPVVSAATQARVAALRAWRMQEAARQALDIAVVLPQRLLDRLAEAAPRSAEDLAAVPGLRRWRVATFGPALLQVVSRAG